MDKKKRIGIDLMMGAIGKGMKEGKVKMIDGIKDGKKKKPKGIKSGKVKLPTSSDAGKKSSVPKGIKEYKKLDPGSVVREGEKITRKSVPSVDKAMEMQEPKPDERGIRWYYKEDDKKKKKKYKDSVKKMGY